MALASSGPPNSSEPGAEPLLTAFLEAREHLVLFLAGRLRSMATAEDRVQDLYLKIAAMEPGTEARAPKALLYRMASNLLVDHVRSVQRATRRDGQGRMDPRATLGEIDVVSEPAADEALVEKERARLLAEAVAALPPQMGRA